MAGGGGGNAGVFVVHGAGDASAGAVLFAERTAATGTGAADGAAEADGDGGRRVWVGGDGAGDAGADAAVDAAAVEGGAEPAALGHEGHGTRADAGGGGSADGTTACGDGLGALDEVGTGAAGGGRGQLFVGVGLCRGWLEVVGLVEDVLEFLVRQEALDDLVDVQAQSLILILDGLEFAFETLLGFVVDFLDGLVLDGIGELVGQAGWAGGC